MSLASYMFEKISHESFYAELISFRARKLKIHTTRPLRKDNTMRAFCFGMLVFATIFGTTAVAQQPTAGSKKEAALVAPPGVSPEIWAYIQELRRLDDPKLNAQRTAQFKAQQRQARLATQQWFGYSNLRPVVNPIPYTGSYSPAWAGNTWNEYYWAGGGLPTQVNYAPSSPVIYIERR
jgi:hypothetical protein